MVTETYSYAAPGAVSGKWLRVSRPYGGNQTATGDLVAAFGHDTEGRSTSTSYPVGGPTYTYAYDSTGRFSQMTDQLNNVLVNNLQYGPAGQVQQIGFFGATETRQYNSMLQMTQLTVTNGGMGTVLNMQYGYSATQNNGKITMQNDLISGEQVNYTYDSLSRLISAITTGQTWGQGYNYDPFGNLTAKTALYGSVPTMSVGVDATTNRLIGLSYDANGNQTSSPTASGIAYDGENRVAAVTSGGYYSYGYDFGNKRIWAKTPTAENYFFYGPDGSQLGSYTPSINGTLLAFTQSYIRVYFGGKLVSQDGTHPAIQDRLGSTRVDASGNPSGFYPYGEDKGTPLANDQVKFATYTRDSGTQLDYADQRYFTGNYGRFLSPDPYWGSARPRAPQSWNRYAYVLGDPINSNDPSGLDLVSGSCGSTAIPNAAMTGPPAACNTVAAAAAFAGIDTFSSPPTGGTLSQMTTITQVDIGGLDQDAYIAMVNSRFTYNLINGNCQDASDPQGCAEKWGKITGGYCSVGETIYSFFSWGGFGQVNTKIQIVCEPPPPTQPPSAVFPTPGTPLPDPVFPIKIPKCPPGYHVGPGLSCVVTPTGPPPGVTPLPPPDMPQPVETSPSVIRRPLVRR